MLALKMAERLFLLLLSSCLASVSYQNKSCRTYFTHQPPNSLPCNPYSLRNSTVSLQCTVSAPIQHINPEELNFTTIWMRQSNLPGALEEVIDGSDFGISQFGISTQMSRHGYNNEQRYVMAIFVTSSLSFQFNKESDLPGKYWCRVMIKDLDNYSYVVEGDSAITEIKNMSYYLENDSFYPPCIEDSTFHHTELKCVGKSAPTADSTIYSSSMPRDHSLDSVVISKGGLAALAISGGFLTVLLLIVSLMATYSCAVISRRRMDMPVKGLHSRPVSFRPSMQSNETLEEDMVIVQSSHPYVVKNMHPLGIRTSSFGSQTSGNIHRKCAGKIDSHA